MTRWRARIIVGNTFLLVALFFLTILLNIQSILLAPPQLFVGITSVVVASFWAWIAWNNGLFLNLTERPLAASYYVLLWLVIAVLCALAISSGWHLLAPGDLDLKSALGGSLADIQEQEGPSALKPWLWMTWLKTVGILVVRLALGVVLVIAGALALATLMGSAIALHVADLKTGILAVLLTPLAILALFAYVSVEPAPTYTVAALVALGAALVAGINYDNLTVNGDLSRVPPEYERIYVRLRREIGLSKKGLIPGTRARQIIRDHAGEEAEEATRLFLEKDGVLWPHGDDFKLGRQKELTLGTAVLGVLSAFYLLNPGFGYVDFIPDSLPVAGNIDELGASALLLWAFRKWKEDVQTTKGSPSTAQGQLEAP